jgi:hypothetical protein
MCGAYLPNVTHTQHTHTHTHTHLGHVVEDEADEVEGGYEQGHRPLRGR